MQIKLGQPKQDQLAVGDPLMQAGSQTKIHPLRQPPQSRIDPVLIVTVFAPLAVEHHQPVERGHPGLGPCTAQFGDQG